MKDLYYLGIDPGVSGAYAILNRVGDVRSLGLYKERSDLIGFLRQGIDVRAALEKVHSMPKQGVSSTFTFGEATGVWRGILEAFSVPFELITPMTWQREILDFQITKEEKKEDETKKEHDCRTERNRRKKKEAVTAFVLRRYPDLYHLLKIKKNQGIADAICLALYARIRNA